MTERLIVSTEWLANQLDNPAIQIIDIRGRVLPASQPPPHYFSHRADYDAAHIPGAVFVDWTDDLTDPDSPNGTQIAQPAAFAALMESLGVGDDTLAVVYDDAQGMFAARLWWALRYYGHEDVVLLDGGWNKWIAEGRPTTAEPPPAREARFTPRPTAGWRRDINEVEAALESETLLMDVRSPLEFSGQASRANRSGHIPGALNMSRKTMVAEGDVLPTPEALRQQFEEAGLLRDVGDIIVYCNSGVSASYGMLALRLAGIDNASVYDGSWKEWGNDPSRPIA